MRIYASNLNDRPRLFFACRPREKDQVYYDLEQCGDIVQRCAIVSSALTLPTFDERLIEPGELNGYISYSNIETAKHDELEEWRCYRNGEFRYRANFWELHDSDTQARMRNKTIYPDDGEAARGFINIVGMSYRVTAAHVVAARILAEFSGTVDSVTVGLDGIAGYGIGRIDQTQRFSRKPIARNNDCIFRSTPAETGSAFDPYALAAESLTFLMREFGWETTPNAFAEWIQDVRELAER